jgi:hypothetical protein
VGQERRVMSAAPRIDPERLRRALSRVLAPALAAKVVAEATIDDDSPVPEPKRATPEAIERARSRGRMAAKR